MSQNQALRPFDLLIALDNKSRSSSGGMPEYEHSGSSWTGVLVSLGANQLLVSMRVVREIITPPNVTKVPGVLPWMKGIANLRGTLFPVMDLQQLYGISVDDGEIKPQQRLLVAEHQGFMLGFLVASVHGMKNFMSSDLAEQLPEVEPALRHCVEKSFQNGEEHFAVLDLDLLMQDQQIQDVGVRQAV